MDACERMNMKFSAKFTVMLLDILQDATVLLAGGPTTKSQKRNRSKESAGPIKAKSSKKPAAKSSKVTKVGRKPAAK